MNLPVIPITVDEVLILFARAVDRGDLDHADELAAVLLGRNDGEREEADA